jgi:hypothetical protein
MNKINKGWERGLDSSVQGYGPVVGSCEHGKELSYPIIGGGIS